MVGSNGLEPSTSRLSGVCSNQLSYEPIYGGGKEIRTPDPLLARQVLSQLSYTPRVGLNGLEPSTSRLSGVRSNQLSYRPIVVEVKGVEPLTPCVQGKCSPN